MRVIRVHGLAWGFIRGYWRFYYGSALRPLAGLEPWGLGIGLLRLRIRKGMPDSACRAAQGSGFGRRFCWLMTSPSPTDERFRILRIQEVSHIMARQVVSVQHIKIAGLPRGFNIHRSSLRKLCMYHARGEARRRRRRPRRRQQFDDDNNSSNNNNKRQRSNNRSCSLRCDRGRRC